LGLVLYSSLGGFYSLTGWHGPDAAGLPPELESIEVPERRYAVFSHDGNVARISDTIDAIWHSWLPKSGYRIPEGAAMTEVYGDEFDPKTGSGRVEIWIPVEK
jgi:AraC family transcriptional regulator